MGLSIIIEDDWLTSALYHHHFFTGDPFCLLFFSMSLAHHTLEHCIKIITFSLPAWTAVVIAQIVLNAVSHVNCMCDLLTSIDYWVFLLWLTSLWGQSEQNENRHIVWSEQNENRNIIATISVKIKWAYYGSVRADIIWSLDLIKNSNKMRQRRTKEWNVSVSL